MMQKKDILLLDFNPASGLGSALRKIFEFDSVPPFCLKSQSVGSAEFDDFVINLSAIAQDLNPSIIFISLHSDFLKQTEPVIRSIREKPVIVIFEGFKPEELIELLKLGVADFVIPPLNAIDVLPRVWRLLEQSHRQDTLAYRLKERIGLGRLVGQSPAFLSEMNKIPLMAKCDASVLISGETGTGKELCARAIHYLSTRANKPFVPASCGAIPLELVENELFGHVQGAFTSASSSRPGLIHEAQGGTLFLDEIDCLPLPAQVKFLRFLQEKEYKQLGASKVHHADVRIISATNIDLEKAVKEGRFRHDLYYRLNVIPLSLPPLRDRKGDIPLLAQHFVAEYASEFNKQVENFTPEALQKLVAYDWPGNVRELQNVIERAVVFSSHMLLQSSDIAIPHSEPPVKESLRTAKAKVIAQFEKNYVQELLLAYRGNITKAAKAAQKNRRAFWELIRKYGINVQHSKFSLP